MECLGIQSSVSNCIAFYLIILLYFVILLYLFVCVPAMSGVSHCMTALRVVSQCPGAAWCWAGGGGVSSDGPRLRQTSIIIMTINY